MASVPKVIWSEGMLLGQQHFQQWDKYWHYQQQLAVQGFPLQWGISLLTFDDVFLAQGRLCIQRLVALFNNGQWVDFNSEVDGVLQIQLPEEGPTLLNVFISWPESPKISGLSGYSDGGKSAKWVGEYKSIADCYDITRQRELFLAKPNLYLALEEKAVADTAFIKIAELEYNAQQAAYRLNDKFIPAVLTISASNNLYRWHVRVLAQIKQRISCLQNQKQKHTQVRSQFGYGDFIYFNLVKTLVTHWTCLATLEDKPELHPYYLYDAYVRLLGELRGFLDNPFEVEALPVYRQHKLSSVFVAIERQLFFLLEAVSPPRTLDVLLYPINETLKHSAPIQLKDLKQKQFCVAIYHEEMTTTLIEKVLTQVKIAAPSQIQHVVQTFTQGVELTYIVTPGKALLPKRHYHYFILNKQSPYWAGVTSEQVMAVFVSQELASLPLEIISYEVEEQEVS